MFTWRKSVPYVLAASMLVVTAACQDSTRPEMIATDSPALGKVPKPPKPPTGSMSLSVTGNTSWSVSFAWNPITGAASYRLRDNWGREISVPSGQTSTTWKYPNPPLQEGATYSFSAYALSSTGTRLASSNRISGTVRGRRSA